jgi:class 3 adenylate cyclase
VLPAVWIAGESFMSCWAAPAVPHRQAPADQPDLPRRLPHHTLDVDQRLKITSLTFLFTDLKGSTELYERVGDLVGVRSGARAFPRAP